jgi:TonB family protein
MGPSTLLIPMTVVACAVFGVVALSISKPEVALCQEPRPQRNECAVSEALKATKTIAAAYTEEATKTNAEGTVTLCATVNEYGKVTDVVALSGPSELLQVSVAAAKQWQFERPTRAPASTKIEMTYSLTKACPEGKGSDTGEVIVKMVPADGKNAGDLKILCTMEQPQPPYPEAARADRRRGQLYLSAVVNADGIVTDVRIVKPLDELLDKAAVETVRTWKYKVSPEGKPTRFSVTLSYRIPCLDVP